MNDLSYMIFSYWLLFFYFWLAITCIFLCDLVFINIRFYEQQMILFTEVCGWVVLDIQ